MKRITKLKTITKFILMSLFLLVLASSVEAVTVYGEWENQQDSIDIQEGESTFFNVDIFSTDTPIDIDINLYDEENIISYTYFDDSIDEMTFFNQYNVLSSHYGNEAGNYELRIKAIDDFGSQKTVILNLEVTSLPPTNNPPVFDAIGNKEVNEGELLEFTITATDPNDDDLTLTTSTLPGDASFTDNEDGTGTFSWQTNFDDANGYDISFTVSDGFLTDSETITITVDNVNRAPILNEIGDKQVDEGQLLEFTITASDPDEDAISFSTSELPTGATFEGTTFSWTPNLNQAGDYSVTFTVSDSQLQDSEEITISVIDYVSLENSPVVTILTPNDGEAISDVYEVTWSATDQDQDDSSLDIKIEFLYDGFNWATLEDFGQGTNDGSFSWNTVGISDASDYALRVTARDSTTRTEEDEVQFSIDNLYSPNINVINPNENEEISSIYNILWSATDVDQDDSSLDIKIEYQEKSSLNSNVFTFIWNLFTQHQAWIVLEDAEDNNDGSFTWDTTQVNNGEYELRIIVTDDDSNQGIDYVSLFTINNIIQPENNAPVITSSPVTNAVANQLYQYDVDATDADNDVLTYYLTTSINNMNIDASTGLITWLPTLQQVGTHQVIVRVIDGNGGLATQNFAIAVTGGGQGPGEDEEDVVDKVHKFSIANIMYRKENNFVDVYVNIRNEGNQNENVKVKATLIQTGFSLQNQLNLGRNDVNWETIRFNNLNKGLYVVKVEVFNKYFKDSSYSVINV